MPPAHDPKDSSKNQHHHRVFPASGAGHLDTRIRRFLYRPGRLAERYVQPGNRVLDFGCGPGFFTREFAKRVGDTGTVIAVDLQEEMLRILEERMEEEGLMHRVRTHRCAPDAIGLSPELDGTVDMAFAIFVIHEVPDPRNVFGEIASLLAPGGRLFYAEPPAVVPEKEFRVYLREAEDAGLAVLERRSFFVNRAAILGKNASDLP
jgi:ubiquinone/menaquinone biosynthesis C-methylase UbiE